MNNRFSGNDYRGAFKTNSYPKAPDLGLQSLRSYQSRQTVPRQSPRGGVIGAISRGVQNLTRPTGQVAGGAASQAIANKLMGK